MPACLDFVKDRMAMDDYFLERPAVSQKPFANPQEVGALLLGQRQFGIDPGMDEGIVARDQHVFKTREKCAVGLGHDLGQLPEQLLHCQFVEPLTLDPKAEDRFAPAMLEEMAQHLDILEALQEHFLVIAHENANAPPLAPDRKSVV